MTVYIVEEWNGDGYEIVGVYEFEADAKQHCTNIGTDAVMSAHKVIE